MFSSPKVRSTAAQAPVALSAMPVQTSVYGLVVPIVYGTNRIPANLISYNSFTAIPHQSQTQHQAAGKGGGGSNANTTTTSYTYTAAVQLALCEGPIVGIGRVWQDKALTTLANLGLTLFTGTYPQSPWGYLTTNFPSQALGYNGLAHVDGATLNLGSSGSLPNHSFEVSGRLLYGGTSFLDSNPADYNLDILTNVHYGSLFPVAYVGDWTQYSSYCIANNFLMSPILDAQTTAASVLADQAKLTNSEWVWSSAKLNIVPYGDTAITGNGFTFTPNLTPEFDLTDTDFQQTSGEDPVTCTITSLADAPNSVKIEIRDRNNSYNVVPITAIDQTHIEQYGLRIGASLTAHGIVNPVVGQQIADLIKNRALFVRNIYNFKLGWKYSRLDPMDLVTLTESVTNLDRQLVRIKTIDEDIDGVLSITAEQVDVGTAAPALFSPQAGQGSSPDFNAAPGNVNPPVFIEPPETLVTSASGLELWIALSGVDESVWGGADAWISSGGDSYRFFGRITGPARMGVLTAPLPAWASPLADTDDILSVDLSMSNGSLLSGTTQDAINFNTLSYVDGEFLAYQTAHLTGANTYNLTYLVRGGYNSVPGAHIAGTNFVRLDNGVLRFPFTTDRVGQSVFFKFTSFNNVGAAEQQLEDVVPFSYTFQGLSFTITPLPDVQNLSSAFVAGITQLSWTPVIDFRNPDVEIRQGTTWDGGAFVTTVHPTSQQTATVGDGTYWVAVKFDVPNGPTIYSPNPASIVIAGSQLTSNVIASHDEQATGWTGTLTNVVTNVGDLTLPSQGDILVSGDILLITDLLSFGGISQLLGTYQIPVGHRIFTSDISRNQVIMRIGNVLGRRVDQPDLLIANDVLQVSDWNGLALGGVARSNQFVRTSQDGGSTWGDWQDWIPGVYLGNGYDFKVTLQSFDPGVEATLDAFSFEVDVPDRLDHYINVSTSNVANTTITFQRDGAGSPSAFNGGPGATAVPAVQATITNASAGDDYLQVSLSTTQLVFAVKNGGAFVTRTVNVIAEGY